MLLCRIPLDAVAAYVPACTTDAPRLHPAEDARRFQENASTVGTPLTRSVRSDFLPWTQSAELHTAVLPALITSATCPPPTLNMHVLRAVDTTSMSKAGLACAG